jgi:hypothetical protein
MLPRSIFSVAGLSLLAAAQLNAADYLMAHKNATVGVNTNGTVANWTIDGVNQLTSQSLHYRVGNLGGESLLSGISAAPSVTFNQVPNVISSLDITYANNSYSVRTLFQLNGSTAGSGKAGLNETLTIKNLSASPLDFHFFQYSDFNLGGAAGGQSGTIIFDALLQPYKITQTDGVRTITETVNANTAPIGHYQISLIGAGLAGSLADGNPTTLSDSPSAGPGDVVFAYQWDAVLQPNQTITISKLMSIVPEPSSLSLVIAAGLLASLKRRTKAT